MLWRAPNSQWDKFVAKEGDEFSYQTSDGVLDLNGSGVHLFSKLLNVTGTEMAAEFLTELRFPNRTGRRGRESIAPVPYHF